MASSLNPAGAARGARQTHNTTTCTESAREYIMSRFEKKTAEVKSRLIEGRRRQGLNHTCTRVRGYQGARSLKQSSEFSSQESGDPSHQKAIYTLIAGSTFMTNAVGGGLLRAPREGCGPAMRAGPHNNCACSRIAPRATSKLKIERRLPQIGRRLPQIKIKICENLPHLRHLRASLTTFTLP